MSDRAPIVGPGKLEPIAQADRLVAGGLVNNAGQLTFHDNVTGDKTLADLAAGGGGTIGGSTGAVDNALIRAVGSGGSTIDAAPVGTLSDAGVLAGLTGLSVTGDIAVSGLVDNRDVSADAVTWGNHIASTANPHATTAAQVGADPTGTSAAGIAAHVALSDPHNQYQQESEKGGVSGYAGLDASQFLAQATRLLRETGSPATITIGAWPDNTALVRSGSTAVGTADLDFFVPGTAAALQYPRRNAGNSAFEWATLSGSGEINTASNVGSGADVFKQKTGVDLEFRGVNGISGISSVVNADNIDVSGVALLPLDGTRTMTAALNMGGFGLISLGYNIISPTVISAQQNNYSPTSWSGADIVRLTFTGAQTITGFDATATAIRKLVQNVDSADALTLANESSSSTAANRITCPGGVDLIIPFGGSVTIQYDVTASRWRPVEVNNGAVVQPAALLHAVRRSIQLTNISSAIFPAFDVTLQAINSTYWSFSSGTWTCNRAHTSKVETKMSYVVNSGAVNAVALAEIWLVAGGVQLQAHKDSGYSTTDTNGHVTASYPRTWAVSDQLRIYYSTTSGAMDILAAMNNCEITWISG